MTIAFIVAAALIVAIGLAGLAREQYRIYRIHQRLDRRVRSLRRGR